MNRRKLSSEDFELFSSLCQYWCRGKHSITGKTFILIEIILLASYELNKRQRRLLSCGILSLLTTVWQKVVVKGGKNMEVDWDWTSCSRHASGRNRHQGWRLTVGVRDHFVLLPCSTEGFQSCLDWSENTLTVHWEKAFSDIFLRLSVRKCFHSCLFSHDFKACSSLFVKGLPHPLN